MHTSEALMPAAACSSSMSGTGRIKVVVRVRPEVPNDSTQSRLMNIPNRVCVRHEFNDDKDDNDGRGLHKVAVEKDPFHFHDFIFEDVLGMESTQNDVYEHSCKDIVHNFLYNGEDGCVVCYGQSGSGKTFTMFGEPSGVVNVPTFGLIQNALRDVFGYVESRPELDIETSIYISFYEIYLEKIRDLLVEDSLHNHNEGSGLQIRENPGRGSHVDGLKSVRIHDLETGLRLLREIKQRRISKKRNSNVLSSRSHAVVRITFTDDKKFSKGMYA